MVNEDNTSVFSIMKNGMSISHRTRHFRAKYYLIEEAIDDGSIILMHCRTAFMLADICVLRDCRGTYFAG
jgi:hypothetical protein